MKTIKKGGFAALFWYVDDVSWGCIIHIRHADTCGYFMQMRLDTSFRYMGIHVGKGYHVGACGCVQIHVGASRGYMWVNHVDTFGYMWVNHVDTCG
jgi:hypothetical protein